jgi:hypothetical protein
MARKPDSAPADSAGADGASAPPDATQDVAAPAAAPARRAIALVCVRYGVDGHDLTIEAGGELPEAAAKQLVEGVHFRFEE